MAKRALCVGIDTISTANVPPLYGAVQDARNIARVLIERLGFSGADVKDLVNERATKENILRSIDWLRSVSSPGDHVVIYMATYGSYFPDRSGNEADGLDEIIVTHDHHWQFTLLRDDEIAEQIARFPASVRVVCIFDTSHAVVPHPQGRSMAPPGDLPPIAWARSKNLGVRGRFRNRRPDDLPGCLFLSACAETEIASEAPGTNGVGGLYSLTLFEVLNRCQGGESWDQVHAQVVQGMQARGARQTPQIHGPASMRGQSMFGEGAPPASLAQPGAQHAWGAHGQPAAAPPVSVQPARGQPAWGQAAPAVAAGAGAMVVGAAGQQALAAPGTSLPQQPSAASQSSVITPVDTALAEFKPDAITVRLCNTVFKVLPFAPDPMPYAALGDAVRALNPSATAQMMSAAQQYAQSESVTKTLWVANAIDTSDATIAAYSGVRGAVVLFFGENKGDALETDPQQAVDAVLKLLGLSYIIYRLFPGSMTDRVRSFYALPAGQSLAMYYAAIEVGLPFADNIATAGGRFMSNLYQRYGNDAASRLRGMIGQDDVQNSQGILQSIIGPMEGAATKVAPYANKVAEAAKQYVPTAMNVADKAAGVVATGADVMPVYKYLVARLAAEASAQVALNG